MLVKSPQASSCYTGVGTLYLLVVVSCCTADSLSTCVRRSCAGLLMFGLMISMLLVDHDESMLLCYQVTCDDGVSLLVC